MTMKKKMFGVVKGSVRSWGRSGWPCVINYVLLVRRKLLMLCVCVHVHACVYVCVAKRTSSCLGGTWDWPSCLMLTQAAAVTDVLLFRDSFGVFSAKT